MGTDGCEVVETLPYPGSFKVHLTMCTDLNKLVDRILRILPDIEAARPQSLTGIQSLCSLNTAISKAKELLQSCSETSTLFLALTGDSVLSKCQKIRNSLAKSLFQIQGMVPVKLEAKISQIVDDLRYVTFVLNSAEEEAGRVLRELLHQRSLTSDSDSMENSEIESLQFVAKRLNITSPKTILTEKRSIKKLLDNVGPNDVTKKKILSHLLDLLMKHQKLIMIDQPEKTYSHSEGLVTTENTSCHDSQCKHCVVPNQCMNYVPYRAHTSEFGGVTPPDEYKCPISSRLMCEPVIISSGVTYERVWIKKWFEEGNSICPKTKKKLVHMALTPNIAMKDLILKWCRTNAVSIPDPSRQGDDFLSWEASSTSTLSFESSMNDLLNLPLDHSNESLGSSDANYNLDSSHAKTSQDVNLMLINTNNNSHRHQSDAEIHDRDMELLSKLHDLQWDSQYQVIEDIISDYKCNYKAFSCVASENFIEPIIRFLSTANELSDLKALRAGTKLLLKFVNSCRNGVTKLSEDACNVLASLLDSEVTGEALSIMEELSRLFDKANTAASSSMLTSVSKILDSGNREFQQKAIRIMYNLSFNGELCLRMISLNCIDKLLPFFDDDALLRYCICIMKNLCDTEEGRVSFAENQGAISSVAEVLEFGSNDEKEYALAILLSLCSQGVEYCLLVMYEGIIPSLVSISNNGNDNTKAFSLELLRLLKDIDYVEHEDCSGPNLYTSRDSDDHFQQRKPSKKSTILKKLSLFYKSNSVASKSKR